MNHVTQSEWQNEYRKYKSLQTKTDLNRPYTQGGSQGSTGAVFHFRLQYKTLQVCR